MLILFLIEGAGAATPGYWLLPPLQDEKLWRDAHIPALIASVDPFYDISVLGVVAAASVAHTLPVDLIGPAGQLSRIEFVEIVD